MEKNENTKTDDTLIGTEYTEIDDEQLFGILIETIKALGWNVAVPNVDEGENIPGLIVGTPEYVDLMTNLLPKTPLTKDSQDRIYC